MRNLKFESQSRATVDIVIGACVFRSKRQFRDLTLAAFELKPPQCFDLFATIDLFDLLRFVSRATGEGQLEGVDETSAMNGRIDYRKG